MQQRINKETKQQYQERQRMICLSKQVYDTEFEAQRAAWKFEISHPKEEMDTYQCKVIPHWHITHKDKEKRLGHGAGRNGEKLCEECKGSYRTSKRGAKTSPWDRHLIEVHKPQSEVHGENYGGNHGN